MSYISCYATTPVESIAKLLIQFFSFSIKGDQEKNWSLARFFDVLSPANCLPKISHGNLRTQDYQRSSREPYLNDCISALLLDVCAHSSATQGNNDDALKQLLLTLNKSSQNFLLNDIKEAQLLILADRDEQLYTESVLRENSSALIEFQLLISQTPPNSTLSESIEYAQQSQPFFKHSLMTNSTYPANLSAARLFMDFMLLMLDPKLNSNKVLAWANKGFELATQSNNKLNQSSISYRFEQFFTPNTNLYLYHWYYVTLSALKAQAVRGTHFSTRVLAVIDTYLNHFHTDEVPVHNQSTWGITADNKLYINNHIETTLKGASHE